MTEEKKELTFNTLKSNLNDLRFNMYDKALCHIFAFNLFELE